MQVRFSTDDLPPRDRVGLWRAFFAEHAHSITCGPDVDEFRGDAGGWVSGEFKLLDIVSGPSRLQRTAADLASDKTEAFLVWRFRRPTIWSGGLDGSPVKLVHEAGDLCVSYTGWRFEMESEGMASFDIFVAPRAALSPLLAGGRLSRPFRLPRDSALASLLGAAIDAAKAQAPLLPEALAQAVLRNMCGLVAVACGAQEDGADQGGDLARSRQLAAARRHIDSHLADPEMSPASTAAALGISPRQLHRLFEPSGSTFARHVLRQRLLRCRDTIAGATGTGRSVVDIAFGWGFNSMATFYRAFVSEFGGPPTELRAPSAQRAAAGDAETANAPNAVRGASPGAE